MLRTFTSLALLAIAAIAEETQTAETTDDQSLVDQGLEAFEGTLDDGNIGQTAAEV